MSIDFLTLVNLWVFRIALLTLCLIALVSYSKNRNVSALIIFSGLLMIFSSMLISGVSLNLLLQNTISPQRWNFLVIVSNLCSIVGYLVLVIGCFLLASGKNDITWRRIR
jgi:hypothetical protein